ncbi:biosynthetic arginine decarboxylase [Gemmatimonas sp.]|jgi:arginine decarboxylase|uniref:biosynthetic arginine decarboxylase n=1 Tax=Gemmatimonas sp. TaxID=1962908 RepID=UPI0022C50D5E|nr:biosynthetic arginine decarboxylase [Gemmatimonas sp.]MCA2983854.1 biosynthetic arginine decarboxylase [Gemmatimonas sp.]MCA2991500.1 biosynthetic arginine decarboxylase [Gemmatimonas sp.]MCA2996291.1 biosynthetic arginine decarboxylase [Gemmatimonas sp.]MCE2953197.1 biosynthetic arginine decarboxylase [Gemmatimonas sp.]MCZ8013335.1 biosynthetic arginine decarboxylase [Gemmatimonas sp.]
MATRIQPDAVQAPVIPWSIDAARALYNVEGWGAGYFDINDRGHVIVRPDPLRPHLTLDLRDLAADLEGQGIQLPVLLRFSDILRSRIETLSERFATAIKEFEYTGGYTTVYPIKVNQQRHVVEEIVQFGKTHGVGLECGSKPELQAVLGLSETTEHLIVCNGYKDHEFMRLALMGQKLGHQVFIVLEQVSELDVLLEVAEELNVKPTCGVRIKLASEGAGRWAQSGGEKSKFGLSSAELIKLIDKLESAGRLDILKLIHFHLGSQITDIRFIKSGLAEVARFYLELRALGVDITHVDVGGGLGIDYDGTNSTNNASVNYTLQEYANDVIYTIAEACREAELPMPHIISESGRALTAHHALLLLKVIDVESQAEQPVPPLDDEDFSLLHEMHEDWRTLIEREPKPRKVLEVFHDASFDKERARQYFNSGVLNLRGLAKAEVLWLATMNAIYRIAKANPDTYEDILPELESALVDRYFCNFSLFQSLPDSWAIDQLFPIMPIHRLTEEPVRRGTLQDVTCDSDGKIDRFVGDKNGRPSLELHEFRDGEDYMLGIFLTGAYQEILGDLHNLFGDTNAVHVRMTDQGSYEITDMVEGDTVTEVLNYVQFGASQLLATFRRKVNASRGLSRDEMNGFIADFVAGLEGYTYLEGEAAR